MQKKVFWNVCDECGTEGPRASNQDTAMDLVYQLGWRTRQGVHRCTSCHAAINVIPPLELFE